MRIFKKALGFILVNVIVINIMTIMLAPVSAVKPLIKLVQSDKDADTLFVGQSHGETGFDPFVANEELGVNSYNCARRLMPVNDVYYLIKEANKNKSIEKIFFELDAAYWQGDNDLFKGCGDDTIMFFKSTGKVKLEYFFNELLDSSFIQSLADYNAAPQKIEKIPYNLKNKLTSEYINADESILTLQNTTGGELESEYMGRGFRYVSGHLDEDFSSDWKFNPDNKNEEALVILDKLIDYCDDEGIELVFVISVIPDFRIENHSIAHEHFSALFEEKNIDFIDLNYVKKEILPRDEKYFVDIDGHTTGEMAGLQTKVLCDILNSDNREEFFYKNSEDAIANLNTK